MSMRRQFQLPEDDVEGLSAFGLEWEAVADAGHRWLLLHGFLFPEGYNVSSGSVAIQIPAGYPTAQLDMAYFHPHLSRVDGGQLRQTEARQPLDGREWQRWSRHYTWRVGVDNLLTHIHRIPHWLNHGLGRAA